MISGSWLITQHHPYMVEERLEEEAAGAHTARWAAGYFRFLCGLHSQLVSNCLLMESKQPLGVDIDTHVSSLSKKKSIC